MNRPLRVFFLVLVLIVMLVAYVQAETRCRVGGSTYGEVQDGLRATELKVDENELPILDEVPDMMKEIRPLVAGDRIGTDNLLFWIRSDKTEALVGIWFLENDGGLRYGVVDNRDGSGSLKKQPRPTQDRNGNAVFLNLNKATLYSLHQKAVNTTHQKSVKMKKKLVLSDGNGYYTGSVEYPVLFDDLSPITLRLRVEKQKYKKPRALIENPQTGKSVVLKGIYVETEPVSTADALNLFQRFTASYARGVVLEVADPDDPQERIIAKIPIYKDSKKDDRYLVAKASAKDLVNGINYRSSASVVAKQQEQEKTLVSELPPLPPTHIQGIQGPPLPK